MDETRNIVLVCLDAVRKDYFEKYAPRISSRSATSFNGARATSSWSAPSHASMLSGTLPHQHGVHSGSPYFDSLDPSDTVVKDMEDYHRICVSANKWASPTFGFDRYFHTVHEIASHSRFHDGMNVDTFVNERADESELTRILNFIRAALSHEHTAKSLANGLHAKFGHVLPDLDRPKRGDDGAQQVAQTAVRESTESEPYFTFINLMEAHSPQRPSTLFDAELFDVPAGWDSNQFDQWEINIDQRHTTEYFEYYRQLYGASIDYLDAIVTEMYDELASSSSLPVTMIVTADHGENLGYSDEDGLFGHSSSLSEAILHVPLEIINPPSDWPNSVGDHISHLELPRLIRHLSSGESYTSPRRPDEYAAEIIGMSGIGFHDREVSAEVESYWDRMIRCYGTGDEKFTWDSLGEVCEYNISREAPCKQSLISRVENKDTASEVVPEGHETYFDRDIRSVKSQQHESVNTLDLDAGTENRLKDLGYL